MSGGDSISAAFVRHSELVGESMHSLIPDVKRASLLFSKVLKRGGKVLICGNGGSAADSQHFAAELTGRYKREREALPAISLTTDTSALTAIANDYGYERVFSRQVDALGFPGDVLVAISTSGASKNVLEAIKSAKKKGMLVVVLTGARGKSLRGKVDVAIIVPSEETARIQEMHQLVYHSICENLDGQFS